MRAGIPACEAIDTNSWDFHAFEQTKDIMMNPIQNFEVLDNDVLLNGQSIVKDAEEAVAAYDSGDFITYGEKVGAILRMAGEDKSLFLH